MRGHANSLPFSPKLQSSLSSFSHTLSPSSTGLILAGRNLRIGLIQTKRNSRTRAERNSKIGYNSIVLSTFSQ